MIVAGAACTSSSGMFIKLSGVNAGTAAFLRCAIALVVLAPLAFVEYRRLGARSPRLVGFDLAAGALLGLDYVCWVQSIHDLGASIATLLLNVQLVVFPLLTRMLTGVPLSRRFWLTAPVLLTGCRPGERSARPSRARQRPGLRRPVRHGCRDRLRRVPLLHPARR